MNEEEWEKLTSILPDEMKKKVGIETDMAFQRYKERRRDNARILLFEGMAVLIVAAILIIVYYIIK